MAAIPSTSGTRLLLWLAFALFLVLRAWGIDFDQPPVKIHADERHYAGIAAKLQPGDLNPRYHENPPLLTYALVGAKEWRELWRGERETERWVNRGGLVRLARWISALLGTLTAFAVGAAAHRLLANRAAGVVAMFLVGVSYLHGRDSHYGVNDVPMVFLVALSLLWSARYLLGDGARWLWMSAVAAGLAAATKYNGAVAMALPVAAIMLRAATGASVGERDGGPRLAFGRAALVAAGLVAASLAAFVVANPYALIEFGEFRAGFTSQLETWGDNYIWGQSRAAAPLLYLQASLGMLGWLNLSVALFGILLLWLVDRRVAIFLTVFPVLYLAGMWSKTLFFWRFALPLLPFLAIAGAAAWLFLAERVAPRLAFVPAARRTAVALTAAMVLGCYEPGIKLVRHDMLAGRRHTWLQALDWVKANVPTGSHLFLEGYPPRFPDKRYQVWLPRLALDKLHDAIGEDEDGNATRVVFEGGWLLTDSFYAEGWKGEPDAEERAAFYERIDEVFGPPVAEFAPGPQGDPQPFVLDSLYTPLVDLWSIDRPGHTIRVYYVEPLQWREVLGI
ncbi:MAG: ArnT family glycosyltransferase [Planctomycetota bacterium]